MLKLIGGIVLGLVVAVGAILLVQLIGHIIYPTGAVDMRNQAQVAAMIAALPLGAMLFVVLAWFAGALAGGAAAAWMSGRRWTAWLIGAIVALMGILNVFTYPHPVWMQIAAVIAPALGGIVAGHFARGRHRPAGERM